MGAESGEPRTRTGRQWSSNVQWAAIAGLWFWLFAAVLWRIVAPPDTIRWCSLPVRNRVPLAHYVEVSMSRLKNIVKRRDDRMQRKFDDLGKLYRG